MEFLSEVTKVDAQGTKICKYKSPDEDGNEVDNCTEKNLVSGNPLSDFQATRCLVSLLTG